MKIFIEIHLRFVATVWLILMAVLSLLYLINYMKFDSLMSSVVSSKLEVISSSLESSILKAERLGIHLKSANNLPDLMERAKSRDVNVKLIHIIGNDGVVIYSTDSQLVGQKVEANLSKRALRSTEANWMLATDKDLYSGLQLKDSFDELIGSVVIQYDKSSFSGTYAQVRLHLLEMTVGIFLIFSLVVFLVIRLCFGDISGVIHLIEQYTGGEKVTKTFDAPEGSLAFKLAEQMKQGEQMKAQVSSELDAIQTLKEKQKTEGLSK